MEVSMGKHGVVIKSSEGYRNIGMGVVEERVVKIWMVCGDNFTVLKYTARSVKGRDAVAR